MERLRVAGSDDQLDTHAGGFHSIHRRGEVSHGILALVSTICGGGSLSIPWAFAQSGLPAGLVILIVSALLSALGVHFLLCGARRAGGLRSFDSVLEAALGPWARIFTIWAVVITCFLTLIANSLLLRQLAAPLAAEYVLERALTRNEEVLLGSGLVCIVVPCTYLNTLHSLRHGVDLHSHSLGPLPILAQTLLSHPSLSMVCHACTGCVSFRGSVAHVCLQRGGTRVRARVQGLLVRRS